MKNIIKVVSVIIGTVIGAGFASGQEILIFFNKFGINGLIGILVSVFIISYTVYKTFEIMMKNDISSYKELINKTIGKKRIISDSIMIIINTFLLISFYVMVSGFAAYFLQELNINRNVGAIIIAILSFLTFLNSIDGVVKINVFLIPTLVILIIFLGFKNIEGLSYVSIEKSSVGYKWLLNGILYASYNSIILIPIIVSLKKYISNKRDNFLSSIIVGILMLAMSAIIYFLLYIIINEISNIEIPIIYLASRFGKLYKYIYGVVILIAIFTSAISAGYGFLMNCTKTKKGYIRLAILICVTSIMVSNIGFSNLVSLLYPIFGYLGILQLAILLKESS